jgi:putative ABC transport system permease protein
LPLTKIHLYADSFPELSANGNIQYVYIFSAVAIFILLIACINFMNLSTARSAKRAKEVGIRKVLGTEKRNLVQQFLTESTLMTIFSLILAIIIAWMVLPLFNDVSSKSLTIQSLVSIRILPLLIALPFLVGLLAGSYPAFFLSSFQPIQVLKGKINAGFKRNILRSSLVTFQFFISILLIIGTIVVYKQLNFIQTTKLGFNKDQVLIINGTGALGNNAEAFKNEVLNMPGVVSGSFSGYLPVSESSRGDRTYSKEAVMNSANAFNMQTWYIDYDYINTLGMEIIQGRNFSRDFRTDSNSVIINESTAKVLGYTNPVGQKLYAPNEQNPAQPDVFNIIGVVKNFHFESLRQNISPLCFVLGESRWLANFKVNSSDIQSLVKQVESKWKSIAPSLPFSYRFLDESFDNMYRAEQRVGKIALSFAVLTILIACLGLFGLATYMAEQRTKEIGVRKVLGATVSNIVNMLSKDFLKLVILSAVFAVPLGWWIMNKWLEDFAYRIDIAWWVFVIAIGVAVVIALFTVSYQAIKAAVENPVKSLRTE